MRRAIVSLMMVISLAFSMVPVLSQATYASSTSGSITRDVSFDCVYFGSYPQAEIVSEPADSGVYGKSWCKSGDYIVDRALYKQLMKGSWDSNGDIKINGVKYHKMKKKDACWPRNTGVSKSGYYDWADATAEHYFKYEPVKWRILSVTGNKALLLADIALDDQPFDTESSTVKWEDSTVRTWLNKTFYNAAFSSSQKNAIITSKNKNVGNLRKKNNGGSDTSDKVFLLSESEVYTDAAVKNGFSSSVSYDLSRNALSSTYAKARGVYSINQQGEEEPAGSCQWWLRSPGSQKNCVVRVDCGGAVGTSGDTMTNTYLGIRPAIVLDLSKGSTYSTAPSTGVLNSLVFNTISGLNDQYPLREGGISPEITIAGLTKGTDYTVEYENNTSLGTATVRALGTGVCHGELSATFNIVDSIDISDMTLNLSTSSFLYKGKPCCPVPSIKGLKNGEDYVTSYVDNNEVGIGEITVTGINGYTGSICRSFKIFQDINELPIETSGTEFTYKSSSITPEITIYDDINITAASSGTIVASVKLAAANDSAAFRSAALSKNSKKKLVKGTDYTVSFKNNKKVGKASATIKGIGMYGGTKTITFKINPQKAKIKSTVVGKNKVVVKLAKKVSTTGGTVYQIKYRIKGKSSWKTTNTKTTSKALKKLKKGKKYQIKVRACKTVGGKKYYGAWSTITTTSKIK